MKKLAVLTQPLISNYGGILQNYALQRTIENLGCSVETINRLSKKSDFELVLAQIKQFVFRHNKNRIFLEKDQRLISSNTSLFLDKYISKIDLVNPTNKDLFDIFKNRNYDCVIVGSDQVWRPKYANNIYNDFLDFLPSDYGIKKISYAASFGTSTWEFSSKETEICSTLIKNFDIVSVREDSGIELCKKYFNINSIQVLDPTLLIEKEKYEELISDDTKRIKGVFTYILDKDAMKESIVERISNFLHLDVFSNQPSFVAANTYGLDLDLQDYVYPSVEGWLKGFRDAEFVITDSFHGTVFSIIFNKPFVSIANDVRGKSRFESLLKLFGLENRLVSNENLFEVEMLNNSIDYEEVNRKIQVLKDESIDFIKNSIK